MSKVLSLITLSLSLCLSTCVFMTYLFLFVSVCLVGCVLRLCGYNVELTTYH